MTLRTVLKVCQAMMIFGACSPATHIEDLQQPTMLWSRDSGLCGKSLAVDANGGIWDEPGGCEDGGPGFKSRGRATARKFAELQAMFKSLPENAGPGRDECNGKLQTFSIRSQEGAMESRTCWSGVDYDDLTGVDEPYLSTAKLLLSLP